MLWESVISSYSTDMEAWGYFFINSSLALYPVLRLRLVRMSLQPSWLARWSAIPKPMPLLAPVTKTVLIAYISLNYILYLIISTMFTEQINQASKADTFCCK